MSATDEIPEQTCPKCGAIDSGMFCSSCGSALAEHNDRSKEISVTNLLNLRSIWSSVKTLLFLARRPYKHTIVLLEDQNYSQYFQLMLGGYAILLGAGELFTPDYGKIRSAQDFTLYGEHADFMRELNEFQYSQPGLLRSALVLTAVVISFYTVLRIFNWFSKEPKSKQEFTKLFCIAASVFCVISIVIFAISMSMYHFDIFENIADLSGTKLLLHTIIAAGGVFIIIGLLIYNFIYLVRIYKYYWGFGAFKTTFAVFLSFIVFYVLSASMQVSIFAIYRTLMTA